MRLHDDQREWVWAPSLNFRRMRLRGGWAQPRMALRLVARGPF